MWCRYSCWRITPPVPVAPTWTNHATWPKASQWSSFAFTIKELQKIATHHLWFNFRVVCRNLAVSELKPTHQALIDRIVQLHEDGISNRQITNLLNLEATLTPRGKIFTTNHVLSMVKKGLRRRERIYEVGTIENLEIRMTAREQTPV
jgi:hypothetical protein